MIIESVSQEIKQRVMECMVVYRELLNARHAFERNLPRTEQLLQNFKRHTYELIRKYDCYSFEIRNIISFDTTDLRRRLDSLIINSSIIV